MSDLISISEAADRLGTKPWEVIRLVESGRVRQVVLIDATSLAEYQEQQ